MAAAKTEDVKLTSIRYPGEDLGIWTVLRGFFVIVSLLLILVGLSNGSGGAVVVSLLMLILLLPYTNIKLKERMGFGITRGLKIFLLIILLAIVAQTMETKEKTIGGTAVSNTPLAASPIILKSDLELLPTGKDLPTEYRRVDPHPINLTGVGFESGVVYATSRSDEDLRLAFTAYRFNTPSNASTYYDKFVKDVEAGGGYTELSVSTNANCFSYKKVLGSGLAETGKSVCLRKNVVFVTEVTSMLTNVDSTTKDMTKLFDSKVK